MCACACACELPLQLGTFLRTEPTEISSNGPSLMPPEFKRSINSESLAVQIHAATSEPPEEPEMTRGSRPAWNSALTTPRWYIVSVAPGRPVKQHSECEQQRHYVDTALCRPGYDKERSTQCNERSYCAETAIANEMHATEHMADWSSSHRLCDGPPDSMSAVRPKECLVSRKNTSFCISGNVVNELSARYSSWSTTSWMYS